jgi:hypothetical protein
MQVSLLDGPPRPKLFFMVIGHFCQSQLACSPIHAYVQGWAKLVLIALERYSVEFKRLTFNFR